MVRALTIASAIGVIVVGLFCIRSAPIEAATDLFSPAQVKRGEGAFIKRCAACHGADLAGGAGSEQAPPLVGEIFSMNWKGKPARAFYSRIISTMPASDPGSVPPKDVLDIVAYIFSRNGVSIGSADAVSPNELNAVAIGPSK
jgi:mono/diheme cytochrome c family protein